MSAEGIAGMRPAVTVVVPFAGSRQEAEDAGAALTRLRRGPGDALILVDNSPLAVTAGLALPGLRVIQESAERSSYFARNAGTRRAETDWVLFIDADCVPGPDLLDRYFDREPAANSGILAGSVVGAPDQESFAARYARSRGQIEVEHHLETGPFPAGVTANLMVKRACWEALGGFTEGVISGADLEFCWRAQEAGWGFESRLEARVEHRHPETIAAMAAKARRHAAGRAWLNRIRPGALPAPRVARPIVRGLGGALVHALRGRGEQSLFKLADLRWAVATLSGYRRDDNIAEREGVELSTPEEAAAASSQDPSR